MSRSGLPPLFKSSDLDICGTVCLRLSQTLNEALQALLGFVGMWVHEACREACMQAWSYIDKRAALMRTGAAAQGGDPDLPQEQPGGGDREAARCMQPPRQPQQRPQDET
jgi:hypothetical protein